MPGSRGLRLRPWFGRPSILIAWAILLIVAVHPPHGLGVPICWMEPLMHAPCPGCGLTRSMSSAVRGMFRASLGYHPFGIAFLTAFAGLAVISLLPRAARQRLIDLSNGHKKQLNVAYAFFIAAFLLYGVARAALHHMRFDQV